MKDPDIVKTIQNTIMDEDSFSSNSFIINGMDLSQYVPKYWVVSENKRQNGGAIYHLRSDSCKTLWMETLYTAIEAFMKHLGYETSETFNYLEFNGFRKRKHETALQSRILKRLEMKYKYQTIDGHIRKYVYIVARFMDNDPDLNYGFSITFYARNVDLMLIGNHSLSLNGIELKPNDFVHQLLLTMKYPQYMYAYQKMNGTLDRLVWEYNDLIHKRKGTKYEPWNFPCE